MLPHFIFRRHQARAGLPALRTLTYKLLSGLLLCLSIGSLQAQSLPEGYELHPLGGGLSDSVAAVHAVGDNIYYGGNFTQAYNAFDGNNQSEPVDYTKYIARWDGSQWHALGSGTNTVVNAIASANDGSIYVGGLFTQVTQADGTVLPVNYIARFKNGQWSAVASGVNSSVYSLAVVERPAGGHDLYVGGGFTTATDGSGTKTVNRLAKWDGNNWQPVGAGVNNSVLSIVHSKARGGLYIGGWFTNANAFGSEAAVTLNRAGFWDIAEQKWQAMGDGTSGNSVATFQESSDGQSVFVSGYSIGLKRFDWASNSWTTLSTANTYGMQLLPDQQRLIALTSSANNSLQLWDISAVSPAPHKLANFSSSYILHTTAIHRSGVYLGVSNVVDQYRYAARLVVPDMDGDSVANDDDNCPLHANSDQADDDADDYGDTCDAFPADASEWMDTDSDTIGDNKDNCRIVPNTDQADQDGDGHGDVCDAFPDDPTEWADTDGDTIGDNTDNCPSIVNTDQANQDGDGHGDTCDTFPADDSEWLDSDGDGAGDNRDQFDDDPTRWFDGNPEPQLGDAAKQNFGQVIVNLGDIDDDYVDDYAVGTPNFSAVVNGKKLAKAGRVQIFSGRTQVELFTKTGSAAKQLLGASMAAGDYNGDGVVDVAIGVPGYSKARGQVTVCLGEVVAEQWTCREKVLNHSVNGAQFGASLATQTVAGAADGLIVGAPKDISLERLQPKGNLFDLWQYSQTPKRAGSVSFYSGLTLGGTQSTVFPNDRVYGAVTGGLLGTSVAWLAESQQIAAGAPKANKTGEVLLWDINANAFELLKGQTKGEQFGKVLHAGSLAENTEHLLVAAPLAANGTLKQAGRVDVFELATSNQTLKSFVGTSKGEQLGASLAIDDKFTLFAGSPNYTVAKTASSKAIKKAGKVSRFILAANEAQAEKVGTQANQQYGASLAAIEMTGDFNMDLLVGSIGANDPTNKKLKAIGKLELINANDWPQ